MSCAHWRVEPPTVSLHIARRGAGPEDTAGQLPYLHVGQGVQVDLSNLDVRELARLREAMNLQVSMQVQRQVRAIR